MGLLSGYRPLVRRIGSFKLSGNGKRRPQVTKTLSTLSTNQLLVSDAGDDHGESRGGGGSSAGSSRPRNQKAIMDGKKCGGGGGGGAGEAPAASGSTKEDRRVQSTRRGEEGNHSASSSSSLLSGDRRGEEFERQWRLGSGDSPGSPSFREYCHISVSDTDDNAEDGPNKEVATRGQGQVQEAQAIDEGTNRNVECAFMLLPLFFFAGEPPSLCGQVRFLASSAVEKLKVQAATVGFDLRTF
ncbi:hypothetical protein EJ110_NYTH12657 [Nymphaea thermarum]|nr:hypothetical protein EJ110_NYTH12657 [Nymphaea thermarum]